jgi:putative flippase GtrA
MFALISIGFNLGSQYLADFLINYSHEIYISMFVGTGVGLVVKYILDKKYIFFYKTETAKKDFKTFFLYTGMGIITTAIFWSTELLFDLFVTHENAKYAGGFIGLIVGYTIKYLLDKKMVFKEQYE